MLPKNHSEHIFSLPNTIFISNFADDPVESQTRTYHEQFAQGGARWGGGTAGQDRTSTSRFAQETTSLILSRAPEYRRRLFYTTLRNHDQTKFYTKQWRKKTRSEPASGPRDDALFVSGCYPLCQNLFALVNYFHARNIQGFSIFGDMFPDMPMEIVSKRNNRRSPSQQPRTKSGCSPAIKPRGNSKVFDHRARRSKNPLPFSTFGAGKSKNPPAVCSASQAASLRAGGHTPP